MIGARLPRLRGLILAATLVAALAPLAGCSMILRPPEVRGNKVDPDELKQLVPGTSTQADATSLLGSPTAKGTFDQNDWYYISEVTRPVIAGTQGVLKQQVVVLNFNNQGLLQHVSTLDQKDAMAVPIVGRSTPSPGTEANFFQQLLGNIGRFNPGVLGQSTQAPSGGAPTR